jgi:glycosyltransferase involved in cell wall biosynthesis
MNIRGNIKVMDKVSVIIPFYNGNKHLLHLKKILDRNYDNVSLSVGFEVVIVNDSPWIKIEKDVISSEEYEVKIVNHENNGGIHQARVTGLKNATGNYILFLDQDDAISKDCIKQLYHAIKCENAECVIGNGIFETNMGRKIILDSYGKVIAAKNRYSYFIIGNMLCSPGQCMIQKSAIPEYWCTHIVKSNCADDLFLWCLLMKKKNIAYCNKFLYLHVNTGINLSLDKANGYKSDLEVFKYLEESSEVSSFYLKIFKLRYSYNIQKLNKKIDNPLQLMIYKILKNAFKLYMRIIAIVYYIVGKKYQIKYLQDFKLIDKIFEY